MSALILMLLLCMSEMSFGTTYPVELTPTVPACYGEVDCGAGPALGGQTDDDDDTDAYFVSVACSVSGSPTFAQADGVAEIDLDWVPDGDPIPGTYAYHAGLAFACQGAATSTSTTIYTSGASGAVGASDIVEVGENPDPGSTIVGQCYIDFGQTGSASGVGTFTGSGSLQLDVFGTIYISFGPSAGSHYGAYSTLEGMVSVGTFMSPTASATGSYVAQVELQTNGDFAYDVDWGITNASALPGYNQSGAYNSSQFVSVAFFAFTVPD